MNNKLILLITLISGQVLLAQKFSNNVFIEFGASNKTFIIRDYNLHPTIQSNYYTINQRRNISTGSIYLSLNLGYVQKNGNHVIFGISQDAVENSYSAVVPSVNSFTPTLSMTTGKMLGFGGISCTNFSLLYQFRIINSNSICFRENGFFRVFYNLGISYFYKPNNGIENLTGSYGQTFTAPDSNKVSVIFTNYNLPVQFKSSFKLNTGLSFSFGKNNNEHFALTLSYITNRMSADHANYMFTKVETNVTNNSGTKTISNSIAYFKSAGNGFYITLSKKIFPFKILNDYRTKKIEKYKKAVERV